ncbi:MAG TPA: sugar transferase [Bryobacteraceae bacterium]|nr:sugar transferase [Bryobacteraceae bacterium]
MIRLFRVFIPTSVVALLVSEIILTYTCYVAATFLMMDVAPEVFLIDDNGWLRIAIVVGCLMFGIYFHDLYTQFRIRSRILLFQQVIVVVGVTFLTQALLVYLRLQDLILPTWVMITGSGLTLVLLPVWRIIFSTVVMKAMGSERVLFLGTSSVSQEIVQYLMEHPETGLTAIGFVDNLDSGAEIAGAKLLGRIPDLATIVGQFRPDRIVVGMTERRERLPVNQLLELRLSGIHIEDALTTYESTFGRISTRELRPSQLIFSAELGPNPNRVLLQSVYSMTIAFVAAVVTLPIMALVAIAVKLSSSGPALYRQRRVGKNDVPFMLYKFRSMYANAEAQSGAVWAKKDDPRITPVGRWLRRLRLDELPQLFNVLKGDMSVVGPRPERPEFVAELERRIPYYRQRNCIKPGITGWAQINHKYGDTIEDTIIKLEYDLYYIKNLAPALDAFIMFHTAKVMLLSRGSQ